MKYKLLLIITFVLLADLKFCDAQYYNNPKIQLGVSGGVFRISIERYSDFYDSRVALPVGGSIGYSISPSLQIMVKGKYFQKTADKIDPASGRDRHLVWQERWLGVGIQQSSFSISGTMRSHFGFGLALFFIDEKEDGDFLLRSGYRDRSIQPRGFYLSLGFDRFITKRLTFSMDIELSSAGVGKGTSLEAQSIGGIYGGMGFNLLIF